MEFLKYNYISLISGYPETASTCHLANNQKTTAEIKSWV